MVAESANKFSSQEKCFMVVRRDVMKHMQEIALAVPAGLKHERLVRTFLSTISNSPKILEIASQPQGKRSLLVALMESASLGLECDGLLGQGYLIPYGKVVKFQTGAQGIATIAHRSDRVLKIDARTAYAGERFEVRYGTQDELVHVPILSSDKGEPSYYYAVASLRGGATKFVVMTREEMEAHRDRFSQAYKRAESNGKKDSPWHTDFGAMAHKTMVIQLCKWLPKSTELQWALQAATRDEREETEVLSPSDEFLGDVIDVSEAKQAAQTGEMSEPRAVEDKPGKCKRCRNTFRPEKLLDGLCSGCLDMENGN